MTRDISTAFSNELLADQYQWCFLYKAEFPDGDFRAWTGLGDLTFDNEVYTGVGSLISHTPIKTTENLEANSTTYRLSGVDSSIISITLNQDYWGVPAQSWFAVIDNNGVIVDSPYRIFSGFIDQMNINDNGDNSYIDVICENDFFGFKNTVDSNRTPENQKQFYPADKFFDSVPTIVDKTLTWGAGRKD